MRRIQKGQAIFEYALIGLGIILAFAMTAQALRPLLKEQMHSTRDGLNTPGILNP